MCKKDATGENTERAQGTEKSAANANNGKRKRKSRQGQKGEKEHNRSKDGECHAGREATEQAKSTTETAEKEPGRAKEGRPNPAERKKSFLGTRSSLSDRNSFGKWEIKERVRDGKPIHDRTLPFCRQCQDVIHVSEFAPFPHHVLILIDAISMKSSGP
jgi:hypothetical protein